MSIRLNGGGGRGTTDKEETEKELGEEVGETTDKDETEKELGEKEKQSQLTFPL